MQVVRLIFNCCKGSMNRHNDQLQSFVAHTLNALIQYLTPKNVLKLTLTLALTPPFPLYNCKSPQTPHRLMRVNLPFTQVICFCFMLGKVLGKSSNNSLREFIAEVQVPVNVLCETDEVDGKKYSSTNKQQQHYVLLTV